MSGDPSWPAWATESVEVLDADPRWAVRGKQERTELEVLLAPWLTDRVAHIGSTAVPDLAAKPIIDLQAAVVDLAKSALIAAALAPHHWHYVPPELDQRPWERFFVKVTDGRRSAHLHVMIADGPHWPQKIAFRDALRADPTLVAEYAALKRTLAVEHGNDREAYTDAKASFVHSILRRSS